MSQGKRAKLSAVMPDPERAKRYRDHLGRVIETYGRLKAAVGGRRGAEWLVATGLGLLLAVAISPNPWRFAGLPYLLGVTVLGAVFLRVLFLSWYTPLAGGCGRGQAKNLILMLTLLVAAVWITRGWELFAVAMVQGWSGVSAPALGFAAPLMVGPLLACLLMSPPLAMLLALVTSALSALVWNQPFLFFAYFLVSGVAGAHYATDGRNRFALIKAGLRGMLPGLLVIMSLALAQGWFFSADLVAALVSAALGGALSGVLAAGLAPLVEITFGFTTKVRLMELASLDQPALQELMLQAPGTYHHSLVVSSLVEAAAKEIDANHLLAKVAALYHDLGKAKKGVYFVENQAQGPNRHDKLAPSMSALILISHVKEGVELAKKYRLGPPIIDIIGQHHGTRIISYFYSKACEARRAAGQPDPDPEAFRYPGPRPQTREAGLVMLADTVEAAGRSLDNPTPARIQGLVQQQINKVFSEGQLDECELTLKDLHKVAKVFNAILCGIFHQRLEYPSDDKAKKKHGDSDRQPPRGAANRPSNPDSEDSAGLRRLGMRP